ncbi:hypothetical protein HNQ39_004303 [Armatimonas rosea]|uniref:Uncharacterized protein n=1 Tax=Armatimonas rosea TaxID=685828 RepID=A0A7W9STC0_ARMRO|nr:hypothetical protein [Armatimonas rosea]
MKWQRTLAVLGVVGLLNVLAIVAVARPWLPYEEQARRRSHSNIIFYTRYIRTFSWEQSPHWTYSRRAYRHLACTENCLTLGFLTVTLQEQLVIGLEEGKR